MRNFRYVFITLVCLVTGATKLHSAGEVYAWGENGDGQIGDGTSGTDRLVPTHTHIISNIVTVAGGYYHSLALKSNGTVWAWGEGNYGQLGDNDGSSHNELQPVQVQDTLDDSDSLKDVIAIAAGARHSLAIKADSTVWAWGYNFHGQLGDNKDCGASECLVPVHVHKGACDCPGAYLCDIIAISGGYWYSLALKSDSTVWAWGDNVYGQLGIGTFGGDSLEPCSTHICSVLAIAAGYAHSLALKSDSTVWAWGDGDCGQLGNNNDEDSPVPVQVQNTSGGNLTGVIAIAAGYEHSLALKSDSTVWAWGSDNDGQIGCNDCCPMFGCKQAVQVHDTVGGSGYLKDVIAIAGGYMTFGHSLAIKSDSTVWTWGDNCSGQLGVGDVADRLEPVKIGSFSGINFIGDAGNHSLAVKRASPLAVELVNFDAQAMDGYVLVWWETASEIDLLGYNLYRSIYEDSAYIQINTGFIYGQGSAVDGASYSYQDTAVETMHSYWYKLGEVGRDNNVTYRGPVNVEYMGKGVPESIYLDILPAMGNNNFYVKYGLPRAGDILNKSPVSLKLYDVSGRVARVLFEGNLHCGSYSRDLDLSDFSSGIYFLRLGVGDKHIARKVEVFK